QQRLALPVRARTHARVAQTLDLGFGNTDKGEIAPRIVELVAQTRLLAGQWMPDERPDQEDGDDEATDDQHATITRRLLLPPGADHGASPRMQMRPSTPLSAGIEAVTSAARPGIAENCSRMLSSVATSGARKPTSRMPLRNSRPRICVRVVRPSTGAICPSRRRKPRLSLPPRKRSRRSRITLCGARERSTGPRSGKVLSRLSDVAVSTRARFCASWRTS